MCGIGGFVSLEQSVPFNEFSENASIKLLKVLEDRGSDAIGLFLHHVDEKYHLNCWKEDENVEGEIFKTNASVSDFFKNNHGEIDTTNLNVFLVHTRKKSRGSTKVEDGHPFMTKDFILAHNGTVTNDTALKREFKLDYEEETDSPVIVHTIQHWVDEGEDVASAIAKASDDIWGAMTCWLYDKRNGDLYLFRRNRPLHYIFDADNGVFIFGSEKKQLEVLHEEDVDIKEFPQNKIFQLTHNEFKEVGDLVEYQNNWNVTSYRNGTLKTPPTRYNNIYDDEWWDGMYGGYNQLQSPSNSRQSTLKHDMSDVEINDLMVDFTELMDSDCEDEAHFRISRIYDDIVVTSNSSMLEDIFSKIEYAGDFKYNGNNTDEWRFVFFISDISSVICEYEEISIGKKESGENPMYGRDWVETMTSSLCHLFNMSFNMGKTSIEICAQTPVNKEVKSLFSPHGLWFSKKGIIKVPFKTHTYRQYKKVLYDFGMDYLEDLYA